MRAHVVVVDVMMPSIRGDKLAALVRRNPRLADLGIVLVSGATPESLLALAQKADAGALVQKDCLSNQLVPAVLNACRSGCCPYLPVRAK